MWKFGYVQLAPSMGISNIIVVLPRFMQGGCLGDTQKVTKKVASEDLLGALVGKKGGIRETKIGDMAKKNILARGGGIVPNKPVNVRSFQTRTFDGRDEELKRLCRLVRELELEARGRRQRRNHEEHVGGLASAGSSHGEASHKSGFHRHREQS